MLVIEELDDWHPRITVVHIIAESRRINNSQADCEDIRLRSSSKRQVNSEIGHTFEKLLFELCLRDFYLHSLVDLLGMATTVVGVILDRR